MAISARIDELRKKFDENPRRYFAPLANEYRKAGDPGQAIFICETYLPQQPGHMSGHIVFGQALYELNRLDEARSVFETALSLDPENLIALRHLGDIARKTGDNTAARNWYQRVLEADPRNDEIAQIVASLAFAADSVAATPDAGVTAETSTTLVMEPPTLPPLGDAVQLTPPRGNLGLVEHFDSAGLTAPGMLPPPALSPPPLAPPSLAGGSVFDLLDQGAPDIRMSGPSAQVRRDDATSLPAAPFVADKPSLPTPPFELKAVSEGEAPAEDLAFEADSFAIMATPAAVPAKVEDDGHLDGAFVDESAFEPFSLGSPIPEIDDASAAPVAPAGDTDRPHTEASHDHAEIAAEPTDEPPPLPFVDMPTAAAILAPHDESPAELPAEDDELAMFLAQHTQHTGIASMERDVAAIDAMPPREATLEQPEIEAAPAGESPPATAESTAASFAHQTPALEVSDVAATPPHGVPVADEGLGHETPIVVEAPMETSELSAVTPIDATFTDSHDAVAVDAVVAENATEHGGERSDSALIEAEIVAPLTVAQPEQATEPTVSDAQEESAPHSHGLDAAGLIASAGMAAAGLAAASHLTPAVSPVIPKDVSKGDQPATAASEIVAEAAVVDVHEESAASHEPAGPPDAFATETMAELYLQQGHLEPALDIYKRLVEQHPDDPQLRERLGAIERRLYGTPPVSVVAEHTEAREAAVVGPTIREFLSVFASGHAVGRASPPGNEAPDDHHAASQVETLAESDLASQNAQQASAASISGAHGSIDALFHGADAHVIDVNAAIVLAEAFAPEDGRPVNPILGHLDGATSSASDASPVAPAGVEPGDDGFSFDQFFAGDAGGGAPTATRDAEPAPGDAADVAQFNQWLSGLKKPS